MAWAGRLASLGPANFYSDTIWTQYTPGYLYFLWFGGLAGIVSELFIKISVIFADIAAGYLIAKIISKVNPKFATTAFLLYVLNPIVIFNGSVWGQIDGILTLFLLLSSYFIFESKKPHLAGVFFALSFLIKPQAIAFVPVGLLAMWVYKYKLKDYLTFAIAGFSVLVFLSIPFFPSDNILGLVNLVEKMTEHYNYTSLFAYNFWAIIGMWKSDAQIFLGITYHVWGLILYAVSLLLAFLSLKEKLSQKKTVYLAFALAFFASFLFPTRVHERYLFPMFAYLLVAAGLSKNKLLKVLYIILSLLHLINLYHPYAYYSDNFLRNETLLGISGELAVFISIFSIGLYIVISKWPWSDVLNTWKISLPNLNSLKIKSSSKEVFPSFPLKISAKHAILVVIAFALFTRLLSLSFPRAEYFDEVYHAFTARTMLNGDPKAWEWWNTPPEGFAYEWTHPPVAKLGMVLGMLVFGENSFGWRFPGAILGVVSVYLIYLIAKTIFKDEWIGVIAAATFSLDGLPLVISRIGMNDSYLLVFSLASVYFMIKGKNLSSAIFLGLALASKWSGLWLIPILIAAHLTFVRKVSISLLFFAIIPPLIYLASYIPMFTSGHTFEQFIGVQKQMWWYHTRLNATHPYTSPWWNWPFLVRSVYLYTSQIADGAVSKIYLLGNPLFFWGGLASVVVSIYLSFKNRNKTLAFVVFGYLAFFAPWAASPRIMFLYHYLPSLPFLAIIFAYVLRKYPQYLWAVLGALLVLFIYFYPHWTALFVPVSVDNTYYWFSSWR